MTLLHAKRQIKDSLSNDFISDIIDFFVALARSEKKHRTENPLNWYLMERNYRETFVHDSFARHL